MRLSQLPIKTNRNMVEDKDRVLDLLLRGGYIRKVDKNQYAPMPLGQMIIDNLKSSLTQTLIDNRFIKIDSMTKDDYIKDNIKLVMPDLKSYKDLPQGYYEEDRYIRTHRYSKHKVLDGRAYLGIRGLMFYPCADSYDKGVINITNCISTVLNGFNIKTDIIHNYNIYSPQSENLTIGFEHDTGISTYKSMDCGYNIARDIYTDNRFKASSLSSQGDINEHEYILTPDIKTIEELTAFLDVKSHRLAKTLLINVDSEIMAVLIRGDRELNLYKVSRYLGIGIDKISMATNDDIESLETTVGFIGPVNLGDIRILGDREMIGEGFITGSNKEDHHISNVLLGRDYDTEDIGDFIYVDDNEAPNDSLDKTTYPIVQINGLGEITKPKTFKYKDSDGNPQGIYGLYLEIDLIKLLYIIGMYNIDDNGFNWPSAIAPYDAIITVMNVKNEDQLELGRRLEDELSGKMRVLLDDRNLRAGAKFYDSEIWGIPMRITVGKKAVDNVVELKLRSGEDRHELCYEDAIKSLLQNY